MKTLTIILIAVIVGGGAFVLYKKYKGKKNQQTKEQAKTGQLPPAVSALSL